MSMAARLVRRWARLEITSPSGARPSSHSLSNCAAWLWRDMLQRVVDDKYPAPPNFYLRRLLTDLHEVESERDALKAAVEQARLALGQLRAVVVNDGHTWGSNPHFEKNLEAAVDELSAALTASALGQ